MLHHQESIDRKMKNFSQRRAACSDGGDKFYNRSEFLLGEENSKVEQEPNNSRDVQSLKSFFDIFILIFVEPLANHIEPLLDYLLVGVNNVFFRNEQLCTTVNVSEPL